MSELLKINVNDHVEKKGNLTYLSWAWAWAEVLKIDPGARWTAHEWDNSPVMYLRNGTAMVKVSVEIAGDMKTCILPVMDNRNRAIVDPDAFAVNTATMRCLTKAIAMHGLALYIFAGEDLPEGEKHGEQQQVKTSGFHSDALAMLKAWNIRRWLVRAQVTKAARMSACVLA